MKKTTLTTLFVGLLSMSSAFASPFTISMVNGLAMILQSLVVQVVVLTACCIKMMSHGLNKLVIYLPLVLLSEVVMTNFMY